MKPFHRLIHNKKAMTGMIIGFVVVMAALAVLLPVGVYLNAQIYASLPTLTGEANTTAMSVRDNVYAAYQLSTVVPLVAGAGLIITAIVGAFAYMGRPK